MYSERYSDLPPRIRTYLGFRGARECAQTDRLIAECLDELEKVVSFRYLYRNFSVPPAFLCKQPYLAYLEGSGGVLLSVMTLGAETDRYIKSVGRRDLTKSVVADACASALLEVLSDEYERELGDFSYRFCPGYGGSDVKDIRQIFALLKPEKIGVVLTETDYMLPSKSMAGILAAGKKGKKSCGDCVLAAHCAFRKEGKRCYGSTD